MLVRYGTSAEGKPVKKAELYTAEDHRIDPALIDPDARRIVHRLRRFGFKAYIVGGAVRDLITGLRPKDFDIATEAFPRKIRRIFRHSRIIGRRFRIVHVYSQHDNKRKIFEVSTFRSRQSEGDGTKRGRRNSGNNIYGSMEEDAWRRDFSLNALYYCPDRQVIIDFVGGYRDIQEKKLRTLAPTDASFSEDPVRMIRGIKYAELTGFPLPPALTAAIKRHRDKLADCSPARLTEEVYKILGSGYAAGIFLRAYQLRLLAVFLPALHDYWRSLGRRRLIQTIHGSLGALDKRMRSNSEPAVSRGVMLAYLLKGCCEQSELAGNQEELVESAAGRIREAARPLLPSRRESERAARLMLRWKAKNTR